MTSAAWLAADTIHLARMQDKIHHSSWCAAAVTDSGKQ